MNLMHREPSCLSVLEPVMVNNHRSGLESTTPPRGENVTQWSYAEAFSRNLGLISPSEQERLRNCRVAIPGMGGVGGNHLMTLTRMGIGKFRIADADEFEAKNFNRQFGATLDSLGHPKADVMSAAARSVNPQLQLDVLNEYITPEIVAEVID